jgi:hypothetical protein
MEFFIASFGCLGGSGQVSMLEGLPCVVEGGLGIPAVSTRWQKR